LHVVWY